MINPINKAKNFIKKTLNLFNKWPCPEYKIDKEPNFLFIITQPYSGSTALAQILNSCNGTALLHEKGEGQWLIPGLCQPDRWNPEKSINWNSVRAVWFQRISLVKALVQDVQLIIEKSPPNLVRVDQLINTFPNHTLMVFNRNPFANCSSILYRNYSPESKSEKERLDILKYLTERWLSRSRWLKKWIDEKELIYFSYEEFCSDPGLCVSKLAMDLPILKTVNVNQDIKVKDYDHQGIQNQNARQVSNLSKKDIIAIAEVLREDLALVEFFGYDATGSSF